MKSIYYLISFILILHLASCDSLLERYPLGEPNTDSFYANETEIQGGVNACYGFLNDVGGGYGDARFGLDGLTDIVYLRGAPEYNEIVQGAHDFKSTVSANTWSRLYQAVGRCNLLIMKMEVNGGNLSAAKLKQLQGEAYFLRGYYYLRLIQHFGDVIYTEEPITDMTQARGVTRTKQSEVYTKILADFDKAAQLLEGSSVKSLGRATWGSAMAYKARAALYQNDWKTAADAAKKVIDSDRYDLFPTYQTLFTEASIRSSSNKEQIFTIDQDRTAGRVSEYILYTGSRAMGGWSTIVPTQNLIDSYECVDGKDIASSTLFNRAKPYENRDPRMRFTCVVPGDMWYGAVGKPMQRFDTHIDSMNTVNALGETVLNGDCFQRTAYTTFTGYLLKKNVNIIYQTTSSNDESPFMICRYAEVLLTYAEAKVELNEIDADCLAAINKVRTYRADVNMPAIESGLSQNMMRKAVRHERKIELAGENLRLQDLRRWKRAEKLINGPIFGRPIKGTYVDYPKVSFDEFGDPVYDYANYASHPSSDYRVVVEARFDPARDYLWGIPEKDLSLNPGLGQNPKY